MSSLEDEPTEFVQAALRVRVAAHLPGLVEIFKVAYAPLSGTGANWDTTPKVALTEEMLLKAWR
jgi:hypothetical protein